MSGISHNLTLPGHARQRGLSMIELMVAITLSLIMLGGVLTLFISSKRGYAIQDASGRLQENARFASSVLGESIRMADYWGGSGNSRNVTLSNKVATTLQAASTCDALVADTSTTITSGIIGYSGGTYSSLPTNIQNCIASSNNYVPNTDLLLVRYADPEPNDYVCDTTGMANCSSSVTFNACSSSACSAYSLPYVRFQPGFASWVFLGGQDFSNAPTNMVNGGADPIYNAPYVVQLYYVRPCAVQANGSTCQKTDDGGQPKPTLVEVQFVNGHMTPQAIIDGVEMMKFLYGIDAGGTKKASQFQTASSVGNWEQVVSVAYSLIVRADAGNNAAPDTSTYTLVDGSTYTPSGVTLALDTVPDKNYTRRLYNATVQVRNRVRY